MGLFSRKQEVPPADHRWDALNAEYQNYRRRTAQELEQAEDRQPGNPQQRSSLFMTICSVRCPAPAATRPFSKAWS